MLTEIWGPRLFQRPDATNDQKDSYCRYVMDHLRANDEKHGSQIEPKNSLINISCEFGSRGESL